MQDGFEGCVSGVEVSGENLEIITSATDSANVQDCSNFQRHLSTNDINDNFNEVEPPRHPQTTERPNPCRNYPCLNNGACRETSDTDYFCACGYGFTGKNCEIVVNVCDRLTPCQNGGSCIPRGNDEYKCNCPLFYSGKNCDQRKYSNRY